MIKLLIAGFAQVFLVTVQTYLISKVFYPGVFIIGFLISFVWSWNVKKVAFGTISDRIAYSLGAAIGALVGLYISHKIFLLL